MSEFYHNTDFSSRKRGADTDLHTEETEQKKARQFNPGETINMTVKACDIFNPDYDGDDMYCYLPGETINMTVTACNIFNPDYDGDDIHCYLPGVSCNQSNGIGNIINTTNVQTPGEMSQNVRFFPTDFKRFNEIGTPDIQFQRARPQPTLQDHMTRFNDVLNGEINRMNTRITILHILKQFYTDEQGITTLGKSDTIDFNKLPFHGHHHFNDFFKDVELIAHQVFKANNKECTYDNVKLCVDSYINANGDIVNAIMALQ